MSLEQKVRTYILESFLFTDDQSVLSNSESLLAKGIIDSTGALELVSFLVEQCGINVEDDDMIPENLDSVNNILAFVGRKQVKTSVQM
jgi:acyl carrier protein